MSLFKIYNNFSFGFEVMHSKAWEQNGLHDRNM